MKLTRIRPDEMRQAAIAREGLITIEFTRKEDPVRSSTMKYLTGIGFLQYLHLAFSKM